MNSERGCIAVLFRYVTSEDNGITLVVPFIKNKIGNKSKSLIKKAYFEGL